MKKETIMRAAIPAAAIIASIGIGFAGVTSAATGSSGNSIGMMRGMHEKPAVVGQVTSISGSTLTVTSPAHRNEATSTYTVNAGSATIVKAASGQAPATSTLSSIAIGDTVAVVGTVSGTSIAATTIIDGIPPHRFGRGHGNGDKGMHGTMGTVTAVNGTTITITDTDGATYSVDTASADIGRISTISASDIKIGDRIGVHGSVSGSTITAKHIMDGIPAGMGLESK